MALFKAVATLWSHRGVLWSHARNDIVARYQGSFFGLFWAVFAPVLTLCVYTFVFSVILQARYGERFKGIDDHLAFAFVMFCGYVPWQLFAEPLARAPAVLRQNATLVKKTLFPIEVLPASLVISSLLYAGISLIVLLLALLLVFQTLSWSLPLAMLVVAPLLLMTMGLCWFVASLGVFIPDLKDFLGILLNAWMFLTPIFYTIDMIPLRFRWIASLNPMAGIVTVFRQCVLGLEHGFPWVWWVKMTALSALVFLAGLYWFWRTRRSFLDVM